jgi:hypothetical protein
MSTTSESVFIPANTPALSEALAWVSWPFKGLAPEKVDDVLRLCAANGFFEGKSTQGCLSEAMRLVSCLDGDSERYAKLALDRRWLFLTSDKTILQRSPNALEAYESDLMKLFSFVIMRHGESGCELALQFLSNVKAQGHFGIYQRCPVGQLLRRVSAHIVRLLMEKGGDLSAPLLIRYDLSLRKVHAALLEADTIGAQFEVGFIQGVAILLDIAK